MDDTGAVGQGMSIYLLHDRDQFHILVPLVIGRITADLLLQRIMVAALVKWIMHGVGQGVQRVIAVVLLDLVHGRIGILPYAPLHLKFPFFISAFLNKRIYTGNRVSHVLVLVVSEFMVIH